MHHRYRGVLVLSLCLLGILFLNTSSNTLVRADDTITVTAKVPAPLPLSPAVITSPTDQQHFTSESITVQGTCDPNTAYVTIYRNNILVAIVPCENGQFTTEILLTEGSNRLMARSFNITDDEGPPSAAITVYYDIPVGPAATRPHLLPGGLSLSLPSVCRPATAAEQPLSIGLRPQYVLYKPQQKVSWHFQLEGGVPPYTITVDWRDKTSLPPDPRPTSKTITFDHTFASVGTHLPVAYATDACGQKAQFPFFATVVNDPNAAPPSSPQPPAYLWPVAILTLIALVILALLHTELLLETIVRLIKNRRRQ